MIRALVLILPLFFLAELQHTAEGSSSRQREHVLRYVMTRGGQRVRPDGRGGGLSPVVVTVDYQLQRIVDLDEQRGLLKTAGYLNLQWRDPRLTYQHVTFRGQHHNVSSIRLKASDIWVPDIELYNTDSGSLRSMADHYHIVAFPTSEMFWVPNVIYTSFCEHIHSGGFNCTLRFGSWTYSSDDLDVDVPVTPNMDMPFPNSRWRIQSFSVRRAETVYDCCPGTYVFAEYNLLLFRQ